MFNLESFDLKLNTEYIGRNFIYSEETDSTNTFLLDKSYKITKNGSVFLTERQNKGRGRLNRVWYSTKDLNLTFSILLLKKHIPAKTVLVNFAASLAVANSIENLYQFKTDLKWPNDVMINGKKIAGILLESTSVGSKIERLVVGIGVNVNQQVFQGNFTIPPTSVRIESGSQDLVDRETFLAELLNNFEEYLDLLLSNPDEVIKAWKQKCTMIGDKISIINNDETIYGIFEDVDDNGFLVLKRNDRLEKIHFGDVSVR